MLAVAGGVLDVAALAGGHTHATGVDVSVFTALPPGWGPSVVLESPAATLTLVPYQAVGYLALAPSIRLTPSQYQDAINIATGRFSPLSAPGRCPRR